MIINKLLGTIGKGGVEPLPQDLLGLRAGGQAGDSPQWGAAQVVGDLDSF